MSSLIESIVEYSGALPEPELIGLVAPPRPDRAARGAASPPHPSRGCEPSSTAQLCSVHRDDTSPPVLPNMAFVVAIDSLAPHSRKPTRNELCVL